MITETELRELLLSDETDRVERTVSTSNTDKFAEAITAFANDLPGHQKPGYLLIGVGDKGIPNGLHVTDALLVNLAALRSDGNIQPIPAMTVAKFSLEAGDVAVIEVRPADLPPVRYKGRVYVRIGPRKAVASEQEERQLTEKRISSARNFDSSPYPGSSLDDLALDLFHINYLPSAIAPEILEENHRPLTQQLASLRFYDVRAACPTNAGLLLFGKNPLEWLPGAYIQFLRIDGPALSDEILMEKRLSGDLLNVLRSTEALIDLLVEEKPTAVSSFSERRSSTYPAIALREIVVNAVLHRSYASTSPIRFYWALRRSIARELSESKQLPESGDRRSSESPGVR
jgi:ATP-dependent DNA helicase RecG